MTHPLTTPIGKPYGDRGVVAPTVAGRVGGPAVSFLQVLHGIDGLCDTAFPRRLVSWGACQNREDSVVFVEKGKRCPNFRLVLRLRITAYNSLSVPLNYGESSPFEIVQGLCIQFFVKTV